MIKHALLDKIAEFLAGLLLSVLRKQDKVKKDIETSTASKVAELGSKSQ